MCSSDLLGGTADETAELLQPVGRVTHGLLDLDADPVSVRLPTQKKEALEYGAGQHYVGGVPRCGLSSTAGVHTEEAWCRIRRSPDHSLAGAFSFLRMTLLRLQLPGAAPFRLRMLV